MYDADRTNWGVAQAVWSYFSFCAPCHCLDAGVPFAVQQEDHRMVLCRRDGGTVYFYHSDFDHINTVSGQDGSCVYCNSGYFRS